MEQILAFVLPILALAGITVGWLTDALSPSRGYGLRADMALGLMGGGAVAVVLAALSRLGDGGLMATFVLGLAGAVLAIVAQRVLWRGSSSRA